LSFRRSLSFEAKQKIRSKNFKFRSNKESDESSMDIDINYSYDLIRHAMIGIENPPNIPECISI